jgi:hypothetical protein
MFSIGDAPGRQLGRKEKRKENYGRGERVIREREH